MKHKPYWLIEQVRSRQSSRDWSKLPKSFEFDQVNDLRGQCINQLKAIDSAGTIDLRIKLSHVTTFEQLLESLGDGDTEKQWLTKE